MAIASLVLGILWLDWIGSVLALIFGYIALVRSSSDSRVAGLRDRRHHPRLDRRRVARLVIVIAVAAGTDLGTRHDSVASVGHGEDRRPSAGGTDVLVRVLSTEDRRDGAPARQDGRRARTSVPVVRVGHVRRARLDPGSHPRRGPAHQPRADVPVHGAPHLRRSHARRHRPAARRVRRRRCREHPRPRRRSTGRRR